MRCRHQGKRAITLSLTNRDQYDISYVEMSQYSTRQAAKKLGLSLITLQRYIADNKIPVPAVIRVGGGQLRIWTDEDIERVRQLLPKIANGRKTRYQKKQSPLSNQHSTKNRSKRRAEKQKKSKPRQA